MWDTIVQITESDVDFDSVRDDPRFVAMMAEAKQRLGMVDELI